MQLGDQVVQTTTLAPQVSQLSLDQLLQLLDLLLLFLLLLLLLLLSLPILLLPLLFLLRIIFPFLCLGLVSVGVGLVRLLVGGCGID